MIGFLIGRNADKKISELTARNKLITNSFLKRLRDLEHAIDRKVEGIINSGTNLTYSDKKLCINTIKSFEEDLNHCDQSHVLDNEYIDERRKKLEKHRQTVLDYNKSFIEQRKKIMLPFGGVKGFFLMMMNSKQRLLQTTNTTL